MTRLEPLLVLSSQAHRVCDIDLEDPNFTNQEYDPMVAYGRSRPPMLFSLSSSIGATVTAASEPLLDLQSLFNTVGKARADAGLPRET